MSEQAEEVNRLKRSRARLARIFLGLLVLDLGMLLCWIWQTRIRRTRPAEALTPPSAD